MPGKDKHNLGYKQAANVERRTWDVEKYEERAKNRSKKKDQKGKVKINELGDRKVENDVQSKVSEEDNKEEFQKADENRAKPMFSERAFLKARKDQVDLESKLYTREIVSVDEVVAEKKEDGVMKRAGGAGWFCKVCDCILKDSLTYLDHINGRKHQRALGYSMRTQKSSLSEVEEKLALLKRKRDEENASALLSKSQPEKTDEDRLRELNDKIKEKDEDIARRRAERKRKKKIQKNAGNDEDDDVEASVDPALAAMMGFSGFGGPN